MEFVVLSGVTSMSPGRQPLSFLVSLTGSEVAYNFYVI